MKHLTPITASLLLLSAVASAQPEQGEPTVMEGVVAHDPLRVVSTAWSDGVTITASGIAQGLRQVLAQPELEDEEVSVQLQGARLVAVEGSARGNIPLLSSPALGARSLATIKAHSTVLITGSQKRDGRLWLRVRTLDGKQGAVSADQLELARPGAVSGWLGKQLAPLFASGTTKREARFFHPDGHVYEGTVTSLNPKGGFKATADKLAGKVLARIGGGAFRQNGDGSAPNGPDVLSFALRFTDAQRPDTQLRPGDQDLLLSAWAERFRHFFVRSWLGDAHDYMKNIYYPAIPFEIDGRPVWLRLVPKGKKLPIPIPDWTKGKLDRIAKFERDIKADKARFVLQVQRGEWWRAYRPWTSLVEIQFTQPRPDIDQQKLKYHPDLQGAGLEPVGFVTGIRSAVYRASQDARDRLGAKQRLERSSE